MGYLEIILEDTSLRIGEFNLSLGVNADIDSDLGNFVQEHNLLPSKAIFISHEKQAARASAIQRMLLDRGWELVPPHGLPNWLVITLIILILLSMLLVVANVWWRRRQPMQISMSQQSPIVTTITEPTPTVTAIAVLGKSEIRVKVLNGTAVSGVASQMAAKLQAQNFNVIDTANADKNDYANTILFTSTKVPNDIKDELKTLLKDYVFQEQTLLGDSQAEVVIILGQK